MPDLNQQNISDSEAQNKRAFEKSQLDSRRGINMPKPISSGSGYSAPVGEIGGPQEEYEMQSARQLNIDRKEKAREIAAQTTETSEVGLQAASQMASKWASNIAWAALVDVASFIGFFSGLAYLNFHWLMSDFLNSKKFSKLNIGQKLLIGALDLIALFLLLIIAVFIYILTRCGGVTDAIGCIIKFGATGQI